MVAMKTNEVVLVEESVRQRVWGQISDLSVQILDGGILLRGHAPSYYLKQLAQEAALNTGRLPLAANNIDVACRY